ncbi:hypothetical protein EROP_07220 [Erysipelotrichaceae bacterium OPF54]|nr:hypothetical protein EROP_07220 [Erysipelotrichaceae bacterium OPF54]
MDRIRVQIRFIDDDEPQLVFGQRDQPPVLFGQWRAAVKHEQDELGFAQLLFRFLDPYSFDFIVGFPDPGRIDQIELNRTEPDLSFDNVACRSGNIGDDRLVLFEQGIV